MSASGATILTAEMDIFNYKNLFANFNFFTNF